jgi:hypothetical protein
MLFDNVSDPYQLENLFDQPQHGRLQDRLHSLLLAELEAAAEPVPEFVCSAQRPRENRPR